MRKIFLSGLATALLLGGAAYAADPATTRADQKRADPAMGTQRDPAASGDTRATDATDTATNPAAPSKSSPMTQVGTQGAPDAMANPSGSNSLQGTIAKVHKDKLTIKDQGGQKSEILIGPQSAVLRDGQACAAKDLKKGDDVRVSYDLQNGKQVATTITAVSKSGSKDATKSGRGQSGSSIQQPVPASAPGTGENTKPDSSLNDRSYNGNTPGTEYRKSAGEQNPNTHNAGVNGNIGVDPNGPQQGDPQGRAVNPQDGTSQP